MRFFKYSLIFAFVFSGIFLFESCSGSKKSQEQIAPMFNGEDTIFVNQLTENFMSQLKAGDLDNAFLSLYNIGPDQLEVISDEQRNQLKEYFTTFPVLDYKLKSTEWKNVYEVSYLYSFEFFEKPDGEDIPNTMNIILKPTKLSDRWFLTLENKSVNK